MQLWVFSKKWYVILSFIFFISNKFFYFKDEADEDDLYPLLLNLRKLDAFHQ
jgi:hypothetical protein